MATLSSLDRLMPRGYIRQMFCFPSTHHSVPRVLKEGLARVISDVPYLLSGIIDSEDHKRVSLTESYQTLDDLYSAIDLPDAINYAVIKENYFPPSAFATPGIIPSDTQPPFPSPAPVFRARLSTVKGGSILCVAIHHCTTDITGFGVILKIWAEYCRAGAYATFKFDPIWMDRGILLERSNATERMLPTSIPELLHMQGAADVSRQAGSSSRSSDLTTSIIFFPQKTLRVLKDTVNEYIASQGNGDWVSTGDILTALLWSALVAAERYLGTELEGDNTVGFPVNFRARFSPHLPLDYIGAAFVMTTATISQRDLISLATKVSPPSDGAPLDTASISRLAKIASTIRTSLCHVDEESVRDVLTYLENVSDDHPPIILGPRHDGMSIVSWADQCIYELDWGTAVGKCEAVRLPKLMNRRYPIVLPRVPAGIYDEDGGLEVIVCLDSPVLEKFERSWPIRRFATLRCHS
ncbi:transferase family-domain-containing protein [Hypoxylon sp. NC1633]|nr:transferase family-domain-containing protein [Hypoxylon sp. NC1633]